MELKGIVKTFRDNRLNIDIPEGLDIEKLQRLHPDGRVVLDFIEKDDITDLQRDHYWALIGDIVDWTGYPDDAVDAKIRVGFMKENHLDDYPSIKRHAMKKKTASQLLEYTILYCINKQIPFRKQQFYLTTDTNKMLYALTMKRLCWECGKPNSQIMHEKTVGMGRNRKTIDHRDYKFMCGCQEHHDEQHRIGVKAYCLKYHFKPIKLSAEDLIKLGLMTKSGVLQIEERSLEIG